MKRYKQICFIISIIIVTSLFSSCFSKPMHSEEKQEEILSLTQNCETNVETENRLNESAQDFIKYGLIDENKYTAYNYVSRIVAVQMISDITGLSTEAQNSSYTHPFIDLSDTAEKEISFLYHNGIIDGITNNSFMEEEICNLDTFLVFLLRALNYLDGQQEDICLENVRETATEKGIISSTYEENLNGLFSVNDAFDICHNALYVRMKDGKTLLTYLSDKGIAQILGNDFNEVYEISGHGLSPFFEESFSDKKIDGSNIKGSNNKTYWHGSKVKGTNNSVTDDGYLRIAGSGQELVKDQQFALVKEYIQGNESYGMTFTVNVSKMSNEGNEGRVIFRVIPRTADENFAKYYAINYYMVLPLGDYQSNLARCKWSITNTNAPSGTKPLVEAYFLLKENVDYTARLLIENTDDGNVHIAFYIDGADRYSSDVKPLLEYTDSSEYKIMKSAWGPAFGNSGYQNAGWGFASDVRFDDIKLYDTNSFAVQTEQLKEFAAVPVTLNEDDQYASQLKYLVNKGVLKPYQRNMDFSGYVSVAQFLASAIYLNANYMNEGQTLEEFVLPVYQKVFKGTETEKQTDLNRVITRYEAALIIKNFMRGDRETQKYHSLYNDELNKDYQDSVYFAVQNSYLLLDENNLFNGDTLLTRDDMLKIFSCAVDSRLRDKNSQLQIPSIISDNAILQGGKPIPISGKGMSGDTVTVKFGGQTKTAKVVDGEWSLELDPMSYGGPYDMTIKDSGYTYTFKRLYVGEVFVVAGQSNAEWSVYESADNKDTLKKFNNQTSVRLFRPVSRIAADIPLFDTETKWEVPGDIYSEYMLGTASAIGVFYVQKLMEINPELKKVKIGIVQITYGGTSIEMFLPDCVNEKNDFVQKDNEVIASGFWKGYMDCVTPYAAKALIYYQGENSAHLGYQYEPMLRDYIWGVREEFNDPTLPVMLVQLAGYGDNYGQENDRWPQIREIQMRVANTTDNVGLVSAIDLSDKDPQNIHPTVKRPIGDRLAYLAMEMIYGFDETKQSSSLIDYKLEGNVCKLRFDAEKLYIKQDIFGDVAFEVLNADGKWIPAQAKIEGGTLSVWADAAVVPQGVRYAWANYPKACLFNEYDLPVLPFNTTKDLNKIISYGDFTTTEHYLKKAYHLLNDNDAIINLSRNHEFRHVKIVNAYLLEYTDGDIIGQTSGDQIAMLKKQQDLLCEGGTTETIVKASAHNLKAGDWIRNIKYNALTQVLEVIDENTVSVGYVANQCDGNIFEVYKNTGTITAEG